MAKGLGCPVPIRQQASTAGCSISLLSLAGTVVIAQYQAPIEKAKSDGDKISGLADLSAQSIAVTTGG
jgi:hypothetical protein